MRMERNSENVGTALCRNEYTEASRKHEVITAKSNTLRAFSSSCRRNVPMPKSPYLCGVTAQVGADGPRLHDDRVTMRLQVGLQRAKIVYRQRPNLRGSGHQAE